METQRVVVTGCSGFLGRYVVEELSQDGHSVVGFDLVEPKFDVSDFRRGDFTNKDQALDAFRGASAICHLGGVGDVYLAEADPALAFRANAFGAKIVCDAAAEVGVRKLIYASTWEVYGKPERNPVDETHPCNPESPYSISKLAGELIVRKAGSATGLETVSLRLGTAYGRMMRRTAVIASFIDKARSRKPLQIFGDGTQFRQFTHATDIARAFNFGLSAPAPSSIYNIVSPECTTIADLARMIADRYNVPIELRPARQAEPPSSVVSSEKARQELGWNPAILFAGGLDELF